MYCFTQCTTCSTECGEVGSAQENHTFQRKSRIWKQATETNVFCSMLHDIKSWAKGNLSLPESKLRSINRGVYFTKNCAKVLTLWGQNPCTGKWLQRGEVKSKEWCWGTIFLWTAKKRPGWGWSVKVLRHRRLVHKWAWLVGCLRKKGQFQYCVWATHVANPDHLNIVNNPHVASTRLWINKHNVQKKRLSEGFFDTRCFAPCDDLLWILHSSRACPICSSDGERGKKQVS